MARQVRWGEPAREDLFQAAAYIARESVHYADALLEAASDAGRSLAFFPERGRRVIQIASAQVREIYVQSYRLIYEVQEESVDVLAFVHAARDLAAWWEREQTLRKDDSAEPDEGG